MLENSWMPLKPSWVMHRSTSAMRVLRIPKPDRPEADELAWIGCDEAREVIVDPHRPVVRFRPAENVGSEGKPMAEDGYGNVHGLEIAQLCVHVDDLW
jgi:hypothetical protein